MSLRIWLPLNGSLENKGLDDITVTNNGATIDNNGKIGKCYSFNGSNSGINVTGNTIVSLSAGDFSIAFWIYNDDQGDRSIYLATITPTDFGLGIEKTVNEGLRIYWQGNPDYYPSFLIPVQEWCHITVVIKNSNCYCYKNGTLTAFREDGSFSSNKITNIWEYIMLGRDKRTGNTVYKGKMNDVRIYDHALSPLEVKQISQGLILHYPLNRGGWGQENLVWNSNWNVHSTTPPESWVNWGSPPTKEIVTIDGKNWLHVISNTGRFQGYSQNWTKRNGVGELTANTKITVSFTAKLATAASIAPIGIHWCNSSGTIITQNWTTTALTTSPERYSFTYTTPADCVAFNIMVGDDTNTAHEVWITDIKLEFGEIATPWCPNSSDELATTLGMNNNIEYDCSGFCNNGEYYAYDTNGSISYTSDTPKYNVSTHIASANPTQDAASGTRYLYGHCELTNPTQMSVAFWLKPITGGYGGTTSNGQGYFCTTNYEYGDTSVGVDYQDSAMNHRDGTVNMNDSASATQCRVIFYPTIGEWHHYVYTYDGQVGRGYKDGVQTATAQFSAAKTLDSFIGVVIGFSRAGGVWRRNDACYSDFRIYATALSVEDIKDLYNLGASIDSNNNLLTYELNEE